MNKLYIIYFSPTSTTKKTLQKIAEGTGISNIEEIDITLSQNKINNLVIEEDALVILGAPVYSSRIPKIANDYFKNLKGKNQPAVCVAVYGNIKYGDALLELVDIAKETSFNPIAGASFIGEHSFSNDKYEIAKNRPDEKDNDIAIDFGKKIKDKILSVDNSLIEVPGNRPYKEPSAWSSMGSKKTDNCLMCLKCKSVCPTDAINEFAICDEDKCIKCFACIKNCPNSSRTFSDNSFMDNVRKKIYTPDRKEPELFI